MIRPTHVGCGCKYGTYVTTLCVKHWDALQKRLDEPPREIPALREALLRHRERIAEAD
jgi:hypothetical protein